MKNLMVRTQTFRGLFAGFAVIVSLAALLTAVPFHAALAQVAPPLGTAQTFAVLGGTTVTNTATPTVVIGDLGVYSGTAVTGFPPGIVTGGTIYAGGAVAAEAQADNTIAYGNLLGQPCGTTITADLGGTTLTPGVYCSTSTMALTGTLTLDALGDPNAVWVFQIASSITTGTGASVVFKNSFGQDCNVFWQVGSSATLGTGTAFKGSILALASITLDTGASLSGRALAQNGAVTLDNNSVSVCSLSQPPPPGTPTLGKAFIPATINAGGGVGGVSTLTITLSNPNLSVATLSAALTDNLPTGVVIAPTPNAGTTCLSGTVTVDTDTVTLSSGSTIPAAVGIIPGTCTVTVDVTAATAGSYINTLVAGALQTSNGNNAAPAVATLTVSPQPTAPPTLSKAFSPATINAGGGVGGAGGVSTLTITLSNPNSSVATLIAALTDNFPTGVVVAPTPNAGTTCGGTFTANTGDLTVTLPLGSTIPAAIGIIPGTCTVTVDVTAATAGSYVNTLVAGTLQTDQGNNAAPAIATLTVNLPLPIAPKLSKAFSPATINAGGVSTLTITLSNPNHTVASLTVPLIDDMLPCCVEITDTPKASTTCGGALTANPGDSTVVLTGGSIPAAIGTIPGTCTVTVDVTAKCSKGTYRNTLPAGALQTDRGSNAAPAVATLTVTLPVAPKLRKTFSPATINAGGVSTLTITLNNPNSTVANLTAPLTDTLPGCVEIGDTPKAGTTCSGALTVNPGDSTVVLTGGSIPAKGSCTVTVDVTAKCKGTYRNTLLVGALQTDRGSNAAQAVATLTVTPYLAPKLRKTFSPATINTGGVSTLTITLNNPNSTVANLTVPLIDTLPGCVEIGDTPTATTTCSGALTANPGDSTVVLTGGLIPANSSCTVKVPVTTKCSKGTYPNKLPAGALQTDRGSNAAPAVATLTVKTNSR